MIFINPEKHYQASGFVSPAELHCFVDSCQFNTLRIGVRYIRTSISA